MVKICGLTRVEDAQAAVSLGAHAVGFIFSPESPRFVRPDRVRDIVESLPAVILKVGVFVNQPLEFVNDTASRAGLTHLQLHGDEAPSLATAMALPVIKVTSLARASQDFESWPVDTMWLIDAHDPVRRGGTGQTIDWAAAAVLARNRRVWLAGGLTPENVAAAIQQVRPFGVDVSSGIESAPGVKDLARLKALFDAVAGATER